MIEGRWLPCRRGMAQLASRGDPGRRMVRVLRGIEVFLVATKAVGTRRSELSANVT